MLCDLCYVIYVMKKTLKKKNFLNEKNKIYFFFKVCFTCNITLCQCKKYNSWLIIIIKYYYEYKIPSKAK